MKRLQKISLTIFSLLLVAGCESQPNAIQKDKAATNDIMERLGQTQPIPSIPYSQIRASVIEAQKLEAKATITYTVERANDGRVLRVFQSIGYPIPGGTSLTNPWQVECRGAGSSYGCTPIGQAEPTGVYTPAESLGTRIIEVQADGSTVLYYTEGIISTYAFPVAQKGDFGVVAIGKAPETSKLNIKKVP